MRIEIVGNPPDVIFDIIKTVEEVTGVKYYAGKISVLFTDGTAPELIYKIKDRIMRKLSGAVKNYILKVTI